MPLKREALGFALAPLPAVLPIALLFGFILADRPKDSSSVIIAGLQLIMMSYGAALLIGVPAHVALNRLDRSSLHAYLGATTLGVAALASVVGILELLLPSSPEQNPHGITLTSAAGLTAILAFEGLALIGAWIFWRVSIKPRNEEMSAFGSTTGV